MGTFGNNFGNNWTRPSGIKNKGAEKGTNVGTYDGAMRTEDEKEEVPVTASWQGYIPQPLF